MDRADGCDVNSGAIHWARVELRAKVRWDSADCVQEWTRRSVVFAQPLAAKHSGGVSGDCTVATRTVNPRRRNHLGPRPDYLSHLRHHVDRWTGNNVTATRRAPRVGVP